MLTSGLKTALSPLNLLNLGIYLIQVQALTICERIHGREGDVEPLGRVVDREDIDARSVERQLPAGPAARRVEPGHGGRAPDVRETGE